MNKPIVRLYGFILLLFAALVGFTSYWSVFDSNALKAESANRRPLIEEQQVKRGFIKTSDGVTIAESHPVGGGAHPVYVRSYPQGSLFGNPVGYSFVNVGQTGIENSENAVLAGERNEFSSILDQLRGIPQQGNNVTLTINSHAQQVATQALQNAIAQYGINGAGGAALDSGKFTPNSVLSGHSPQVIGGVPLSNAGGEEFGDINMTEALTASVNTYFAQVGEQLGTSTMVEYMKRFGFYSDPPLDYPGDQ